MTRSFREMPERHSETCGSDFREAHFEPMSNFAIVKSAIENFSKSVAKTTRVTIQPGFPPGVHVAALGSAAGMKLTVALKNANPSRAVAVRPLPHFRASEHRSTPTFIKMRESGFHFVVEFAITNSTSAVSGPAGIGR